MTFSEIASGSTDWPRRPGDAEFFTFVREERLFCATVAHLLLQKGGNLGRLLDLINEKLPATDQIASGPLEDAQIYVEFTYLRDSWNALGKDNDRKRAAILGLFERIDSLRGVGIDLPQGEAEFNARFMGLRGARILRDISNPGQWSVVALFNAFKSNPDQFRDLCKFKWCFNIKPDLVLIIPGVPPICIEAKLESKEGFYPTIKAEARTFDTLFRDRKHRGRVTQFELQRFMFDTLLGAPCRQVVLSRDLGTPYVLDPLDTDSELGASEPHISWSEVFARLDLSQSSSFVRRLVEKNHHLASKTGTLGLVLPDQQTDLEDEPDSTEGI
jgi:hypothetical protein